MMASGSAPELLIRVHGPGEICRKGGGNPMTASFGPLLDHGVSRFRSLRSKTPPRRRRQQAPHAALLMANPIVGCPSSISSSDRMDLFPHAPLSYYCNFDTTPAREEEAVTPEKLDGWLRDSIGEIVRNIGEAPLLVQMASSAGPMASPSVVVVKLNDGDTAVSQRERWSCMRKRWEHDRSCTPDGVILVEELKDDEEEEDEARGCSRAWGLVAQGRGMDCALCYILSTCRVRSSVGFCTHFCLVRAKCFGDPTEMQLRKAWLQQGGSSRPR